MRFRFLWIGRTQDPCFSGLEEKYRLRLKRFFRTEIVWIQEQSKRDEHQLLGQLAKEAALIESKLNPGTFLVALDPAGVECSSEELASFLQRILNQGIPEITFVVGGFQGIPERIKNLADFKLSLSKLTLPHELGRIVILEQVYRAVSILRGLPYHK
ncbi:MAG: 23S rRNA (pseudouridine(1915)-N(3))-methyltransferase RlmH [Acidobacteria bacterium]|nr:23S rRNA (pseudouridine(1915)-N(3))-methyltransferase RlmH [Acidobacteriota bacterium]